MREVQFQRAIFGRYLNTTPMLAWKKLTPLEASAYLHSECNVPLRIGRCLTHLRGGEASYCTNMKSFGFLTCSRLSSGFPLAFVLRPILEWLSRSWLWTAFSAYSSCLRFQP
jgi:hypothetical protein